MQNRRSFMKFLTALLSLALPMAPRAVAAPVAAADDFFIVNGWVLTRADLVAMRIDPV
jgi:hypothetical protein